MNFIQCAVAPKKTCVMVFNAFRAFQYWYIHTMVWRVINVSVVDAKDLYTSNTSPTMRLVILILILSQS